ncbi:hypothetical protein [Acidovorax delafieldii]|uniref:hypothetical protein n=1 Tax=Acidovorax delafieldii TaxID=47920 RepID=UPI003ECDAE03
MKKLLRKLGITVAIATVILGPWALQHHYDQRAAAARSAALERAPALVKNHFRSVWSSISREGGEAVTWSGSASEVVYLQNNGPHCWECVVVWARTPSGRYFTVPYGVGEEGDVFPAANMKVVPQSEIIDMLVEKRELEVLKRLGIPVNPA